MPKTKTIDIKAKEWFDKVNGNSYFCGTITLNYGMKTEQTFLMPIQYGYGSQYEQKAKSILVFYKTIKECWSLYSYCKDNNIILRSTLTENCLKRELREIENYHFDNGTTIIYPN
tara:strand:- start:165 stop:509 length:345 start_codon:yes stop_codon:yes gene_type:complete